jgi:hypothetical protein
MKNNISLRTLPAKVSPFVAKLKSYGLFVFLVFVAAVYGFVLLRINSLSHVQPTEQAVTSQVQASRVPHIDAAVVKQLESLQDNSVSVQALFDEARSNPFQ